MNSIIVALIGAVGSILGAAVGAVVGIAANTKLITYRIEELEKKVNKHNNLIERTYELETKEVVLEEQIKVANHRITDLENVQEKYSDNKFLSEH